MSKRFTLNKEDLTRIAIGAGVATGGALLTYLAELVPQFDFGDYTPIVVAGFSILVNVVRKYLADCSEK